MIVYCVRDEVMHDRVDGIFEKLRKKQRMIQLGKFAAYVRNLGSLAILDDALPAVAR
jgi:hypothetical protein